MEDEKRKIRVLLADDHVIVRQGLRTLLAEEPDLEVVGEAADGSEAVDLTEQLQPDVVLLDLKMPRVDGLEAIQRMQKRRLAARIVVLTSFAEDRTVRAAIQAGATGYLLKDVLRDDLVRAIREAFADRPTLHPEVQRQLMREVRGEAPPMVEELTTREHDVLRLIAQGKSNKEIASTLYLSEGTIKGYVSAILGKLGVQDRTQAALHALKIGLISQDEL